MWSATPLNYGDGSLGTGSGYTLGSGVPSQNSAGVNYFTGRSDNFAGTGGGGKGDGVDIVETQLFAKAAGILTVAIGADAGRGHLHEFFGNRGGDTVIRMAKFFGLGGKGTAAH